MSVRKIILIDEEKCNGCGQCILSCAEGALALVNGKAKVVSEVFCDGLGACIGGCPVDALHIVEREAPEFDEKAVEDHLHRLKQAEQAAAAAKAAHAPAHHHGHGAQGMACGCPSSMGREFEPAKAVPAATKDAPPASMLAQWPIQLRLVPVSGRLYDDRDVVIIADCVAAAYPDLHRKLIAGNTIMLSCPKFDDSRESVAKLTEIFGNPLKSVSVAIMEVPCCRGLWAIADQAMRNSKSPLKLNTIIIGLQGEVTQTA